MDLQRVPPFFLFSLLFLVGALAVPSAHEYCKAAKHPDFCTSFISKNVKLNASFFKAKLGFDELVDTCKSGRKSRIYTSSVHVRAAVRDCVVLLEDASQQVAKCQSQGGDYIDPKQVDDMLTWMSAALTDYTTCIESLRECGAGGNTFADKLESRDVEKLVSTSLAILGFKHHPPGFHTPDSEWVKQGRLLAGSSPSIVPDAIVAKDGSGQFRSISAAIAAAPTRSSKRYVIYIKRGVYEETVEIPKSKPNMMLLGDGMRKTIITGSKSVQDPGVTTFTSGTAVVAGDNFLAKGITFRNTAGAIKHQAVALLVRADQAAFFACSFEGFQDTLYAHSMRQYYSQCKIYGTVDFIFGNAAAVFFKCDIVARVPLTKQKNTMTAQGRTDPNQNTGFSFQNCNADGNADLKSKISRFPTFLGRPWKEYSRTVFLKCFEGDVIHPRGWLEWDGDFALSTLFYGEYLNTGPGATSSMRVSWSSQITNQALAEQFVARNFISGQMWLPGTSFPFQLDL